MKNTITNTNKVKAIKSRSTDKVLVKVSRVAYGEIENNDTIVVYRRATQSIVHSIIVFAEKNNLQIKFI